jgi:hypothetical protein
VQQAWAPALATGVDDSVFWGSTPAEVAELCTVLEERASSIRLATQRAAYQRAGLIAATVANMAGKVSRRTMRATDFFVEPGAELDSPDAVRNALIMWGEKTRGVRLA